MTVRRLSPLLDGATHVVWDWNGTLLDDCAHCARVVAGMLEDEGLPVIGEAEYRALFDFPVRAYYERLGFDLSGDRYIGLARRFIRDYDARAKECALHDDARSVLAALAEAGVTSSILSAARSHSIVELLAHHGIAAHFTMVAGLDDHYADGKVERGLAWLKESGHDPARLVLVGDTTHDHEVATALGIRSILVAAGHHARERLEAAGSVVIDRLGALLR